MVMGKFLGMSGALGNASYCFICLSHQLQGVNTATIPADRQGTGCVPTSSDSVRLIFGRDERILKFKIKQKKKIQKIMVKFCVLSV